MTSIKIAGLIAVIVLSSSLLAAISIDEVNTTIKNWFAGNPQLLLKLTIEVPNIEADKCFVAVHRFPSQYVPSHERLYVGFTVPGKVIEVEKYLPAIPVKLSFDQVKKQYRVEYYEPQEFFILVHCFRNNMTVLQYGKFHEIYPKSIIHKENIKLSAEQSMYTSSSQSYNQDYWLSNIDIDRLDDNPVDSNLFNCNIYSMSDPNDPTLKGECGTWVLGPYLYSINQLKTRYKLRLDPDSAIYLTGFYDSQWCSPNWGEQVPNWKSAGKFLTPTVASATTSWLTDNQKIRLAFNVFYRYYEDWYSDSFAGICIRYWLLKPDRIADVKRKDELGLGSPVPNTPEQHPTYAMGPTCGDHEYKFNVNLQTDETLASVAISFSYASVWGSVSLTVSFYKAVRNDNQYTSPYVEISDYRGCPAWYYVWYRDNDPANYEIMVSYY